MSQEPYKLLTLVIPTYNMEKYLTKCLESVTAPCIPPTLEVIVVNDGSKDRSLDIMKAFQQKRPDIIRIIDKENGHYGSCINAGLQLDGYGGFIQTFKCIKELRYGLVYYTPYGI